MQKYVLDRNGNVVATFASDYNDKHTKTLQAGASTYEFTISKQDEAALFLETGNYVNFVDDVGKPWSFSILSYTETHNEKTVYCEDVGIELINKNVNAYTADVAHPFSFYFEMITKNTPWTIGINEIGDLSRKLEWTSNDTGLSRLLSLLTEFDNAECKFNVKFAQNKPTVFKVDIYKQIGNPSTNVQIVYSNELNDITKTESRAEFVTAIQGEGGTPTKNADGTDIVTGTNPDGTTIETPKITFADIEYKDDNYVSAKGDNFLRAVTANKLFNPNSQDTYIEGYYSYDTESPQELLNRTLTQLKKYSAPQYTYEADVQVIDKSLDLGDTVKIIDHDYKPGLYLEARVASLEKSYTDPSKNTITFANYRLVNSSLAQKLADLQNIINSMPTASGISSIITNVINNSNVIEQKILALQSADGRSTVYYNAKPSNAKEGNTAFVKNPDSGNMEIWNYVGGQWTLTAGDATFDGLKTQIDKAQTDAQTAITNANTAVSTANQAVSAAGFANNTADQAKTAAANAQADATTAKGQAANALGKASTAIANASTAINAATDAQTKTNSLVTKVDDIAGTIETLATTETVDQLAGTVATTQSLAQFAADGLKLKADTTTVNQINGTVNDLKGELDVQADKIAATVTANDVTGMLGNYATQSWSEGKISAAKNEITASVQNMTSDMATQTWTQGQLKLTADGFTSQISSVQNGLNEKYTSLEQTLSGVQATANDAVTQSQLTQLAGQVTSTISAVQGGGINLLINTSSSSTNGQTKMQGTSAEIDGVYSRTDSYEQVTTPGYVVLYYRPMIPDTNKMYGLTPGATYTLSGSGSHTSGELKFSVQYSTNGSSWNDLGNPSDSMIPVSDGSVFTPFSHTFTIPVGTTGINFGLINYDYTAAGLFRFKNMKLEKGSLATPWSAAPEDIQSQITQTQSMIDARVTVDGKIAAALSLSADGGGTVIITGKSVHITGQTTIDSGVIKSAMIANATITGAQIANATIIDANIANINGSKIAANSIVANQIKAGTITADKFSADAFRVGFNNAVGAGISLETGAISFQRGGVTEWQITGQGLVMGNVSLGYTTMHGGGVSISGGVNGVGGIHLDTLYANDDGGVGLWVRRTGGTGVNVAGLRLMNANMNGGIVFGDSDTIYLGQNGKWTTIGNLI